MSSITPLDLVEIRLSIEVLDQLGWLKSGKVTSQVTKGFIGHKFGTPLELAKRLLLFGPSSTRPWPPMNGQY